MPLRKEALVTGEVYHVFNRSIAGYKIFNQKSNFLRIKGLLVYYQFKRRISFSVYENYLENKARDYVDVDDKGEKLVDIIAYVLMPTHIHLILRQNVDKGVENFMRLCQNGYAKYFNLRYKRSGPLWGSRFHAILIDTDEYLLHLTRYIHLNPVVAGLVKEPRDWFDSSYLEYVKMSNGEKVCDYEELLEIKKDSYEQFVQDWADYQKGLETIKKYQFD